MPTTALLEGTSGQDFLQPSLEIPEPVQKQETIQDYAKNRVSEVWYKKQFQYFDKIITAESGWSHTADNPTSTAYGIGQLLASNRLHYNCGQTAKSQVDCAIEYIKDRYETPQAAYEFRVKNGWY